MHFKWERVPSVTEGGKEFFYYLKAKNGLSKLTVVWERCGGIWIVRADEKRIACANELKNAKREAEYYRMNEKVHKGEIRCA